MKPHYDNVLFRLTEDQQAELHDWLISLGYVATLKRLALPEPEGFGVKTHLSCLHRFFVRYSSQIKQHDLQDARENCASDLSAAENQTLAFAAEGALQHAAFQLSTSPLDPDGFNNVGRWISKQKNHEYKLQYLKVAEQHLALARERLALEREKFEFNAARQAIIHYCEIAKIATSPETDNEEKIRAARDRIFGKPQPPNNEQP